MNPKINHADAYPRNSISIKRRVVDEDTVEDEHQKNLILVCITQIYTTTVRSSLYNGIIMESYPNLERNLQRNLIHVRFLY